MPVTPPRTPSALAKCANKPNSSLGFSPCLSVFSGVSPFFMLPFMFHLSSFRPLFHFHLIATSRLVRVSVMVFLQRPFECLVLSAPSLSLFSLPFRFLHLGGFGRLKCLCVPLFLCLAGRLVPSVLTNMKGGMVSVTLCLSVYRATHWRSLVFAHGSAGLLHRTLRCAGQFRSPGARKSLALRAQGGSHTISRASRPLRGMLIRLCCGSHVPCARARRSRRSPGII